MRSDDNGPVADYPVDDPLRYLAGAWRLTRCVEDFAAGLSGTFVGVAEFRADGDGLAYNERGELRWDGHVLPAWRALRYRHRGAGLLRVEFDDGRHFHDLALATGHCAVTHPCRDDEYTGEFRIHSADRWRQVWRVRGPAKDQLLRTEFRRTSIR